MCTKSETEEAEGKWKKKMSTLFRSKLVILILAMFLVALILGFPAIQETRIRVAISRDIIDDVSVDTQNIPLVSKLIPPSYGAGAYTLNITIEETNEEFSLESIPVGEYIITWQEGVPTSGLYTINVELFVGVDLKDQFVLRISF